MTFINGAVSARAGLEIAKTVEDIRDFYTELTGIRLDDSPVFLTFESVDRDRTPGTNTLAFATWPTLAFDGHIRFDAFVQPEL